MRDEEMLLESGYEPREELTSTDVKIVWWLHGKRIGRLSVAAAHCQARQSEIIRACAFLSGEGYLVTEPPISDDPAMFD